jgi:HAD superfamily hydrolase (TIGR01450 family)
MRGTPGEIKREFHPFAGFIIDIEGVLIRGDTLIPPALKAIAVLQELEKEIIFLSNISDLTRVEVAAKLHQLGFAIPPHRVMTAAYAAALFLQEKYPGKKSLLLIGTSSFQKELSDLGFIITEDSAAAEVVVVGLDYQLNYQKICEAAKAIKKGCLFVAANLAKVKLTSDGFVVGPGFTVKGLEYATNRQAQLAGKPSHFMFKQAIGQLGLPPDQVLTIGDKLEEDIFGGFSIGTSTCLVLSGATDKNEILNRCKDYRPDFILEDLSELLEY